jgi:hypothetical protein
MAVQNRFARLRSAVQKKKAAKKEEPKPKKAVAPPPEEVSPPEKKPAIQRKTEAPATKISEEIMPAPPTVAAEKISSEDLRLRDDMMQIVMKDKRLPTLAEKIPVLLSATSRYMEIKSGAKTAKQVAEEETKRALAQKK